LLSIFGLTFALGAPLAQVMFGTMMRRTQVLAGMLVFALGALFLPSRRITHCWSSRVL
jgi:predicted MFS family arabinose efflux permease